MLYYNWNRKRIPGVMGEAGSCFTYVGGKTVPAEAGAVFSYRKEAHESDRHQDTGGTIRRGAGLGREYGAKEQNQKKGGEETR